MKLQPITSLSPDSVDSSAYKVQLDIFEGPLDLLLYLIKKDEIDIYDISIERVTKQYLQYINTFKLLNLDLASEFIVMAANLMYIKSRTLLPKSVQPPEDEDGNEDDPRWELIRQLVEYKKFKDAAAFLTAKGLEQSGYFANAPEAAPVIDATPAPLADLSIFDLIRSFQNVLKRFEESHDLADIIDDRFTVTDKIESLLQQIPYGESALFTSLFAALTSKVEVIVTFLALLELVKMNQFRILQNEVLGTIQIYHRDNK